MKDFEELKRIHKIEDGIYENASLHRKDSFSYEYKLVDGSNDLIFFYKVLEGLDPAVDAFSNTLIYFLIPEKDSLKTNYFYNYNNDDVCLILHHYGAHFSYDSSNIALCNLNFLHLEDNYVKIYLELMIKDRYFAPLLKNPESSVDSTGLLSVKMEDRGKIEEIKTIIKDTILIRE